MLFSMIFGVRLHRLKPRCSKVRIFATANGLRNDEGDSQILLEIKFRFQTLRHKMNFCPIFNCGRHRTGPNWVGVIDRNVMLCEKLKFIVAKFWITNNLCFPLSSPVAVVLVHALTEADEKEELGYSPSAKAIEVKKNSFAQMTSFICSKSCSPNSTLLFSD